MTWEGQPTTRATERLHQPYGFDRQGAATVNPNTGQARLARTRRGGAWIYLAISFSVAWVCWGLCWLLGTRGASASELTPLVIGGSFAPLLAAGVCSALEDGVPGMVGFYRRVLDWRMGWKVLVLSLFLIPALAWITAALFEQALPAVRPSLSELPGMYLWLLILGGPVGEEFGWCYLSDRLDRGRSLASATVSLGAVWALWHLPLFFLSIPGLSQQYVPFPAFVAMSMAMRALFAWAYYRGGRNILSNLLMHNGLNVGMSLVAIVLPVADSMQPRLWCMNVLAALCAAFLWWRWPARRTFHERWDQPTN